MNKPLRYLLIFCAALLLLMLAAGLTVLLVVDPNDYRDDIVDRLSEQTGRPITLDGELQLGVFPCCSLQLGELAVGNPTGWKDEEFVRVDSTELSVQLWPLLRGELRVGRIDVTGLSVNLISRRDGAVNWELAAAADEVRADEPPSDGAATDQAAGPLALDADGIRLRDARLRYADEATGDRIELQQLQFSTGRIVPGTPTDISLSVLAAGLLPDRPVKFTLEGAATIGPDGNQGALREISAQLDETRISGWLELTDLEKRRLDFALDADRLDADSYMSDSETTAAAQRTGDVNDSRIDIPVQTLRELHLNGSLNMGELIFEGAHLNNVEVNVAAADGLLRMHPLTAQLYDGTYAGDVRLDVRGAKPRLSVNEKLQGITVAALLADARGAANLAGTGDVSIKAGSSGNTVGELLEKLSGDAAFDLNDGLYRGVDIWYEIRKARALLKKSPAPEKPANPQTELSKFSGTLQFADGAAQNKDFAAELPFLRLQGNGSFNLLAAVMDYKLQARVVGTPNFDDGEDLAQLEGLSLPIRIKGSLDSPSVKVDLGELMKGAAKQKLRDRLKKKFNLFN